MLTPTESTNESASAADCDGKLLVGVEGEAVGVEVLCGAGVGADVRGDEGVADGNGLEDTIAVGVAEAPGLPVAVFTGCAGIADLVGAGLATTRIAGLEMLSGVVAVGVEDDVAEGGADEASGVVVGALLL